MIADTYAGRCGGRKLTNDLIALIANIEEEGEISLARLQKMILNESQKLVPDKEAPAIAGRGFPEDNQM